MKRTRIALIVGSLALLAIVAIAFRTRDSSTQHRLTIGADLTLTGSLAFWSGQLRKGMDLAVDELNAENPIGARTISVVYEDNQGTAAHAVSAWQKLDVVDGVSVVVSCFTPIGQPLRENARTSKLPLLATVTSAKSFGTLNDWSFRDFIPQEQQCPALARYAFETLEIRSAAALVVNDDYGRDGAAEFTRQFQSMGGRMLFTDTFEQRDTNMRTQAQRVIESEVASVLVIGRDQSLGLTIKQLRELRYTGQILAINGFDAQVVFDIVGSAGEGVIFASAYFDLNSSKGLAFRNAFENRYDASPDYVAVYGYTIARYLGQLLTATGGDRTAMRNALAQLDVDSIRGQLRMNPTRDVVSPIGIYVLKNGQRVLKKMMD